MKAAFALAIVGLHAAACSDTRSVGRDDPADFSGAYKIDITYAKNSCRDDDSWKEGDTLEEVPLTITQAGSSVTAKIEGLVGGGLWLGLGSATYVGSAMGRQLEVSLLGTNMKTDGGCMYTTRSVATAALNGDALTGRVTYTRMLNDHADCRWLIGCSAYQLFTGARAR